MYTYYSDPGLYHQFQISEMSKTRKRPVNRGVSTSKEMKTKDETG